jgi:hypothetical protein
MRKCRGVLRLLSAGGNGIDQNKSFIHGYGPTCGVAIPDECGGTPPA